jgi:hypothetical protein
MAYDEGQRLCERVKDWLVLCDDVTALVDADGIAKELTASIRGPMNSAAEEMRQHWTRRGLDVAGHLRLISAKALSDASVRIEATQTMIAQLIRFREKALQAQADKKADDARKEKAQVFRDRVRTYTPLVLAACGAIATVSLPESVLRTGTVIVTFLLAIFGSLGAYNRHREDNDR